MATRSILAGFVVCVLILLTGCTTVGPCDKSKKEPSLEGAPIVPGSTVLSVGPAPNSGYTLTELRTDTPLPEIIAFYRQALADEGWDIEPPTPDVLTTEVKGHYGNCCHFGSVKVEVDLSTCSAGPPCVVRLYKTNSWELCM